MATVYALLGYRANGETQLMRTDVRAKDDVTSSAASAQSDIVARDNEIWEIYCATDLWVAFGTDPTAATGTDFFVVGGIPRNFQARAGEKLAVIDA